MVYWIGRTLELVRIGFINLDDAGKSLDAEFGERHGLLFNEYFGGAGDGMKVVELVDGGRGQAPKAAARRPPLSAPQNSHDSRRTVSLRSAIAKNGRGARSCLYRRLVSSILRSVNPEAALCHCL